MTSKNILWELPHYSGCKGVCYYRSSKPEIDTLVDEVDCFNLDGSPIKREQQIICQSCQQPLAFKDIHPKNWVEVLVE